MSEQSHQQSLRGPVIGAAVLVAVSLTIVLTARLTGYDPSSLPERAAIETVELNFRDHADGSITVLDAARAEPVTTVDPGSNGFLRAAVRALVRERSALELGADKPFRLTRWSDGGLSLEDTATGRQLELNAFGHTNAQAFAQLFNGEITSQ